MQGFNESRIPISELSVLIVAYQRPDNVEKIVDLCLQAGIERIYIALDAPKDNNSQASANHQLIRNIVKEKRIIQNISLKELVQQKNVGCAQNVIQGCDWIFASEEYVCVLEDDCIPSLDFFSYVQITLPQVDVLDNVLVSCGMQVAPEHLFQNSVVSSSYPQIWGWATTRKKWHQITKIFDEQICFLKLFKSNDPISIYWLAGAKRALEGYVDAWDTILTRYMISNGFKSFVPSVPLVSNVGNDEHATHTKHDSPFLNRTTGTFLSSPHFIELSPELDIWLENNFYEIAWRHLITTRIHALVDFMSSKKRRKLGQRIKLSNFDIVL